MGYVVGIDLGGTKIMTARCDLTGTVLAQQRVDTPAAGGPDAVIAALVATVQTVLAGADPDQLVGVGVGAPGPLDPSTGILYGPPNLPGWERVPLRDILAARLAATLGRPVPVSTANDANAAAWGEYIFGVGRAYPQVRHLAYITVSTGIGGGVINDGKIYEGAHGMAAEVGHITVDLNGPRCKCGNIGCIEVLAAGPAIARRGADLVAAGQAPGLAALAGGDPAAVTTLRVQQAAAAGDPDTLALIAQVATALGVLVVTILHAYNPELVVIGGGVAKMGPLLLDPLLATVQDRAMPAILRGVAIVPAALGDLVGVLGAAALVLPAPG
ncbi:MAG: ROK family protein [Chloroflexota bacterium]|nr:ROK family protein [Chloroflexota bacterium]